MWHEYAWVLRIFAGGLDWVRMLPIYIYIYTYTVGAICIWLGCINIGATIDANPAGTIDAWLNG